MKNWKTTQLIQSFKKYLFFVFCLFYFLLSNDNVMHCAYSCNWNTFQYKWIAQFFFSCHKIISCGKDFSIFTLSRYFFTFLFPICQAKSGRKFLHALQAFPNFSLVCFQWNITLNLGKVNKVKSERVSNWIDAQCSCLGFTSFNIPPFLLPKMTDELLL